MQILITHGGLGASRVLRLGRLQLAAALLALLLSLTLLMAAACHLVLRQAPHDGWLAVVPFGDGARPLSPDEAVRRDRYLRENLDAMAQKVGEMQAKLIRLEAIGDRVSGLAEQEGLRGAPAADSRQPARTRPSRPAAAAQGGPFVPMRTPSLAQLDAMIASLDARADTGADVFTIVESRLFEKRLQSLMVPNSRPIDAVPTSGFGFRADPFTGRAALHTGLDFPADPGTPIVASAGGVVLLADVHSQYGQLIEVDHGNGLVTRYAHASKRLVTAGDIVKRGQVIALSGSSGRSTGPHLHFEVMVDGVLQDPSRFLAATPLHEAPALAARGAAAGR